MNEKYPRQPNVEKIVYQLFGNEDTMYLALQQGDIDMVWAYSTGVAGTYQDVLAGDANVSLINVAAANAPAVLAFNNAKGLICVRRSPTRWTTMLSRHISAAPMPRSPTGALYPPPQSVTRIPKN